MRYLIRIVLLSVIIGYAKAHSFIKLVILAGLGLAGLYMVHTLALDFNNIVHSGFGGSASLPTLQGAGGGLSTIFKNTFGRNNHHEDEDSQQFGNSFGHDNGHKLFDGHGTFLQTGSLQVGHAKYTKYLNYPGHEIRNVYKRSEKQEDSVQNIEQELKNVYKRSEIEAKTGKTIKSVYKRSIAEGKTKGINWQTVLSRDPASCARSFICQLAATKPKDLSKEEAIILELTKSSTEGSSWANKQVQEALSHGRSVTYPYQCMKEYTFCPYTKNMMMALLKFFTNSR